MGGFSASAPMCLTGLVLSVRPCHDFGDLQARGKREACTTRQLYQVEFTTV